jgi:hypothetical protein
VYVGRVINASNGSNGAAFIKIQNGYEIDELHNVLITDPKDSTQALYYDSVSGLWKNRAAVNADLAAITVFPRFDADQSATDTQKRTARRNIGFSDSFTTAQLLALGSTESAKLRIAYCSDCLSSSPDSAVGTGDVCLWDSGSNRWLTFHDKVPPETDFLWWALALARRGENSISSPYLITGGEFGISALTASALGGYVSGTGAIFSAYAATKEINMQYESRPGTSGAGSWKAMGLLAQAGFATQTVRQYAAVMAFIPNSSSVSGGGNTFNWRFGIAPIVFTSATTLGLDDFSFVYDDANTLALGATGSQLFASVRSNGTALDWVPTGVNPATTPKYLIVVWEPEGPASGYGRIRLATADNAGANRSTLVDRRITLTAGTLGSGIVGQLVGGSTAGTGARTVMRRFIRTVLRSVSAPNPASLW